MKVLGYVRVSTGMQAEHGVSLEAQEAKIRAQCTIDGLELVGIEVDAAVSAKNMNRPAIQSVFRRLEAGEAEGLIVAKLDRLTRSVYDLGPLLTPQRFGGRWQLLSVSEKIDTMTPGGRLVLNMIASVSQWERETIAERTKTAMDHLKKKGVKVGAPAIGTKLTQARDSDGRRVRTVDREEEKLVARIMTLRLSPSTRLSFAAIAEQFNREGVPTKRGGRWSPQTISNIVKRHKDADR